jgi:hypothetical protein
MTRSPIVKGTVVAAVGTASGKSTAIGVGASLWTSHMVKYPKLVEAIGMMTIEIAEMEYHLARLLGRLLQSTPQVAEAVYFTPNTSIPRIHFLSNLAPLVLEKNKAKRDAVMKVAGKAVELMGKRHNLVHNRFDAAGVEVATIRYSKGVPEREPISLKKLTQLIDEIRHLNIKLIDLTDYGAKGDWLAT